MSKFGWFLAGIGLGALALQQLRDNPQAQQMAEDGKKAAREFGEAVAEGFREREQEIRKQAKK
jgi:hypothetical protein